MYTRRSNHGCLYVAGLVVPEKQESVFNCSYRCWGGLKPHLSWANWQLFSNCPTMPCLWILIADAGQSVTSMGNEVAVIKPTECCISSQHASTSLTNCVSWPTHSFWCSGTDIYLSYLLNVVKDCISLLDVLHSGGIAVTLFALELLSRQPMPATMFEVTCRWPVLKQHGKKIWNKCNCIMGCWSHMWAFVKCSSKCSTDMITCLDTFSSLPPLLVKCVALFFQFSAFFCFFVFFFIPVNGRFGVDEECGLCTSTWLQKFKTVVEYAIVMWNFSMSSSMVR